jgi:hypothetical protein
MLAFMMCCEMFIFSVPFILAFGPSPYRATRQGGVHKLFARWQAIVDVFNITYILQGFTLYFEPCHAFGKRFVNGKDLGYSSSQQSPDLMTDKPTYVEASQL